MSKKLSLIMAGLLIILGVASRLLPHVANFTPVTAIALFASAYLGLRYSLVIFLAVMLAADAVIGFYAWQVMLAVYGSFALSSAIGFFLQNKKRAVPIFFGALSSSILFFLITNWAVWQFGALYSHSFYGLIESYTMALPFFRNSLAGDLFYSAVLFGAFELAYYLASRKADKKSVIVYPVGN